MKVQHPGFTWVVTPTTDWKDAPLAYHWVAYGPADEDGMAHRFEGFAGTPDIAERKARLIAHLMTLPGGLERVRATWEPTP